MIKALGGVVVEGDQAAIVLERFYPQPVEDVWRAITEPDQLGVWFGPVVLDPRLGGAIATEAGPLDVPVELRRSVGEILEWEPPHVFAYEWRQALVEPSTLRYELHAAGEGTRLQLDHRWLSPQNARGFIPGQHVYLDRLAAHLNGEPLPDWRTHYAAVLPAYLPGPAPKSAEQP